MSYPKSVLRNAMNRLQAVRKENKDKSIARRNELYEKVPELKEVNKAVSQAMMKVFDGTAVNDIKKELIEIDEKKHQILKKAGYGADALEDIHSCKICGDEGFYDGSPCSCYLKLIREEAYKLSNLELRIEKENFSTYNENIFSDKEVAARQKNYVMRYCNPNEETALNLLFIGSTGTGKTFLSSCIAKEFLDTGRSVLYLSATALLEAIDKAKFEKSDSDFYEEYIDFVENCDLLIVDDLGTEYSFGYPQSRLFDILESRTVNGRRTVISTNLSTDELTSKYSPRFYSRIMQDYQILLFKGKDFRMGNLKK